VARILVIEDDALLGEMISAALTDMGHVVTLSITGKDGLAKQARDPADLVLTDIIMPEMDGLGAIRELRRLQPGLKIIAMSGGGRLSSMDYLPTAKLFGAFSILHKPFTLEILAVLVSEALAES
jgi:DNA-binding NtrC family response regulator